MAAAGHSEDTPDRAAEALGSAEFVRLVASADGDALAAVGLLARGLDRAGTPYHASLSAVPEPVATDGCTVSIGHSAGDVTLDRRPVTAEAVSILETMAPDAIDPEIALAGAVSVGAEPPEGLFERTSLERHPGVAVPTDDRIEGLAASTLVHTEYSGDRETVEAAVSGLDHPSGRDLASFLALSVVDDAPPRAAEAVERALRPYATERFETLGGFADVLDAVARTEPGTGLALALGNAVDEAAYDAWVAHGKRSHSALRTADSGRYDGFYVVRIPDAAPASLGTVARLAFWYRSPEPIALAVTDDAAAAVTDGAVEPAFAESAETLGGRANVRNGAATAVFDGTADEFTAAFRRAV